MLPQSSPVCFGANIPGRQAQCHRRIRPDRSGGHKLALDAIENHLSQPWLGKQLVASGAFAILTKALEADASGIEVGLALDDQHLVRLPAIGKEINFPTWACRTADLRLFRWGEIGLVRGPDPIAVILQHALDQLLE